MTGPKIKTVDSDRRFSLLDNALFVCILVVIVLRTTFTEAPSAQASQISGAINDTVYSLCLSAILIFAPLLWLTARLFAGRFSFKFTPLHLGLAIFLIAEVIATFYASNKRSAITASLTMLAPLIMTPLLARLLDTSAKIKILLIVIISLGGVAAWQSAEQYFVSNNIMLEQYKNDPESILQPLNIQPGSLNHMLLEHRIISKDVRAFFTTSNSAGSFAILAVFASIALFAELLKIRKTSNIQLVNLILAASALVIVLFGLIITRSKGAIAAFLIALVVLAMLLLIKHRKLSKNIILAGCVIGFLTLIPVIASYGLKHGRLPGGNSMLVRWQYWHASAKMFLDHPFTGVGPGNFTTSYRLYKPPEALETVSDPHCFVLSTLTQLGVLGLAGFLIFVLTPLWKTSLACPELSRRDDPIHLENTPAPNFKKLAFISALVPVIAMLILRPFLLPPGTASSFDEKLYVFFTDYLAPAAAFAVAFGLIAKSLQITLITGSGKSRQWQIAFALQNTSLTSISLFAALLAVLIHNLIDFAIFESGVLISFCALLACLMSLNNTHLPSIVHRPSSIVHRLLSVLCLLSTVLCLFFFFTFALLPVAKSTSLINQARRPMSLGQYLVAHNILDAATEADQLSPDAPLTNGRLYLQHFNSPIMPQQQTLDGAEQALFIAAQRNPNDSRCFESLAEVYYIRSRLFPDQNEMWLNSALNSIQNAVSLYPGEADSHLRLAQIADELNQTDLALKHYQKTVEIEDGFREMFKQMYPGREVFSRLGNDKYSLAKQRIQNLLPKSPQP